MVSGDIRPPLVFMGLCASSYGFRTSANILWRFRQLGMIADIL
jgi:hypothetical protein